MAEKSITTAAKTIQTMVSTISNFTISTYNGLISLVDVLRSEYLNVAAWYNIIMFNIAS